MMRSGLIPAPAAAGPCILDAPSLKTFASADFDRIRIDTTHRRTRSDTILTQVLCRTSPNTAQRAKSQWQEEKVRFDANMVIRQPSDTE